MKKLSEIILQAIAWIAGANSTIARLVEENNQLRSDLSKAVANQEELSRLLKNEEADDAALLQEIENLKSLLDGATNRARLLQAEVETASTAGFALAEAINLHEELPVVDAAFRIDPDMAGSLTGVPPAVSPPQPVEEAVDPFPPEGSSSGALPALDAGPQGQDGETTIDEPPPETPAAE